MKPFRTVLFWMHLVTGGVAGAVILLMCVTGVVLTYEKQMLEWADRRSGSVPLPADARPLPPETLLASVAAAEAGAAPTGMTMRADRRAPVTVTFEGGRARLVDPYTGAVLGEPSPGLRAFFRSMTSWHRWLALEGVSRGTGKAITGAANLGFLFIVVSGMYLWLPRVRSWVQFKQVLWFRAGLAAKARDFNWHNVIGIWSAVPLAIVVAGAVPISYSWAGNLVFRIAGEAPPQAAARPGPPGGPGGPGGAPPARGDRERRGDREPRALDVRGLDAAWTAAQADVPGWRTIGTRLGGPPAAPFVLTVDRGYGGQPQYRTTVTIDRASTAIQKRETFDDLGPGRQLRSWLRFAHTGEIYGLPGQTIAGLVSAGGAVLVYTGIALALRRWWAWMRRRSPVRDNRQAA
ncbi:MAG: PepSY-associated TM helix domain-containing protein [Vicinamibacterales bacterium]